MNNNQTNMNKAFEKWLKENYPDYPPPLSEVWQAATKASEQRINELESEIDRMNFISSTLKANIQELQAHVNQLREALSIAMLNGDYLRNEKRQLNNALSSTPAQSLAEYDNSLIERIALALENAEGEFKTLPEYVALVRGMKNE